MMVGASSPHAGGPPELEPANPELDDAVPIAVLEPSSSSPPHAQGAEAKNRGTTQKSLVSTRIGTGTAGLRSDDTLRRCAARLRVLGRSSQLWWSPRPRHRDSVAAPRVRRA